MHPSFSELLVSVHRPIHCTPWQSIDGWDPPKRVGLTPPCSAQRTRLTHIAAIFIIIEPRQRIRMSYKSVTFTMVMESGSRSLAYLCLKQLELRAAYNPARVKLTEIWVCGTILRILHIHTGTYILLYAVKNLWLIRRWKHREVTCS